MENNSARNTISLGGQVYEFQGRMWVNTKTGRIATKEQANTIKNIFDKINETPKTDIKPIETQPLPVKDNFEEIISIVYSILDTEKKDVPVVQPAAIWDDIDDDEEFQKLVEKNKSNPQQIIAPTGVTPEVAAIIVKKRRSRKPKFGPPPPPNISKKKPTVEKFSAKKASGNLLTNLFDQMFPTLGKILNKLVEPEDQYQVKKKDMLVSEEVREMTDISTQIENTNKLLFTSLDNQIKSNKLLKEILLALNGSGSGGSNWLNNIIDGVSSVGLGAALWGGAKSAGNLLLSGARNGVNILKNGVSQAAQLATRFGAPEAATALVEVGATALSLFYGIKGAFKLADMVTPENQIGVFAGPQDLQGGNVLVKFVKDVEGFKQGQIVPAEEVRKAWNISPEEWLDPDAGGLKVLVQSGSVTLEKHKSLQEDAERLLSLSSDNLKQDLLQRYSYIQDAILKDRYVTEDMVKIEKLRSLKSKATPSSISVTPTIQSPATPVSNTNQPLQLMSPPPSPESTPDISGIQFQPGINFNGVDSNLIIKLKSLEKKIGRPLVISSAKRQGGDNDSHQQGKAVDISYRSSGLGENEIKKLSKDALAEGFTGIGVEGTHLHLDTAHAGPTLWGNSFHFDSAPDWAKKMTNWNNGVGGQSPVVSYSPPATQTPLTPSSGPTISAASSQYDMNKRSPEIQTNIIVNSSEPNNATSLMTENYGVDENNPGRVEPEDASIRYAKLFEMTA
jgi:hypothetical protein